MNDKEMLFQMLSNGDVDHAAKLIKIVDRELQNKEIRDILLEVSFKKESIVPYIVITKLLIEEESANLHDFASILLSNALCWIEGAYYAGFYHQKKAIELEPQNVEFKEYLLMYNTLPDAILSDEDALEIRKQILAIDPNSKTVKHHFSAQRFIGKLD